MNQASTGDHRHDLSVILSAPSDNDAEQVRGYDSQVEAVKGQDLTYTPMPEWKSLVKPCSVEVEKLELGDLGDTTSGNSKWKLFFLTLWREHFKLIILSLV